jgi:DNA polymerase II large subunit
LAAGLAPHTSGAVLERIIGFTESQVCWAHPFCHAARRRNCDGDEDGLMLLMDAFLNFSKAFIPDRRGGLMDLPLVLSLKIDPREIDKEAHNLDTLSRYPLALYEAAEHHRPAKELAKVMGLVESRLGTPAMYEGFGFTLDTFNINEAPRESSYKTLGSMLEKMEKQLALAERIRAVDAGDVAGRVLSTHLLPDILGNLKAFAKQKVRCTKCNAKYRRVPLGGKCTKSGDAGKPCGNDLILTVPQAGVRKYLELSIEIARRYPVPEYTRERVKLAQRFVDDSFAPEKFKDATLAEFG